MFNLIRATIHLVFAKILIIILPRSWILMLLASVRYYSVLAPFRKLQILRQLQIAHYKNTAFVHEHALHFTFVLQTMLCQRWLKTHFILVCPETYRSLLKQNLSTFHFINFCWCAGNSNNINSYYFSLMQFRMNSFHSIYVTNYNLLDKSYYIAARSFP